MAAPDPRGFRDDAHRGRQAALIITWSASPTALCGARLWRPLQAGCYSRGSAGLRRRAGDCRGRGLVCGGGTALLRDSALRLPELRAGLHSLKKRIGVGNVRAALFPALFHQ